MRRVARPRGRMAGRWVLGRIALGAFGATETRLEGREHLLGAERRPFGLDVSRRDLNRGWRAHTAWWWCHRRDCGRGGRGGGGRRRSGRRGGMPAVVRLGRGRGHAEHIADATRVHGGRVHRADSDEAAPHAQAPQCPPHGDSVGGRQRHAHRDSVRGWREFGQVHGGVHPRRRRAEHWGRRSREALGGRDGGGGDLHRRWGGHHAEIADGRGVLVRRDRRATGLVRRRGGHRGWRTSPHVPCTTTSRSRGIPSNHLGVLLLLLRHRSRVIKWREALVGAEIDGRRHGAAGDGRVREHG